MLNVVSELKLVVVLIAYCPRSVYPCESPICFCCWYWNKYLGEYQVVLTDNSFWLSIRFVIFIFRLGFTIYWQIVVG